jgi:hypothetical protein
VHIWLDPGVLAKLKALARTQSAETMSKVVAERLVAQLMESGFVVMRRPIGPVLGEVP